MVLPAPELVVPQAVEQLDELDIAPYLESRMLADRVVGCEENAKLQTGHCEASETASYRLFTHGASGLRPG
jgi:hypothetical protein